MRIVRVVYPCASRGLLAAARGPAPHQHLPLVREDGQVLERLVCGAPDVLEQAQYAGGKREGVDEGLARGPGEAEAHSLGWAGRVAKLTGTRVLEYSYSHLARNEIRMQRARREELELLIVALEYSSTVLKTDSSFLVLEF